MAQNKLNYGNQLIPKTWPKLLRCPICGHRLSSGLAKFYCLNQKCRASFPIIARVPIMLNEGNSITSIKEIVRQRKAVNKPVLGKIVNNSLKRTLPSLSSNITSDKNYRLLAKLITRKSRKPRILVLGGRILGKGMEPLLNKGIELIESDVRFGPRTALICDAHDIPFKDNSFDGVVIQAVLEHVVDPVRCVSEIHRVLKADGLVYAETPFMQQVHGGRYDFNRYSMLGHRRLFRRFQEVASGPVGGPGSALAWSLKYFLLSFTTVRSVRIIIKFASHWLFFGFKYFDYFLVHNHAALDAAFGYYFMGKKSNKLVTDRAILKFYRGGE